MNLADKIALANTLTAFLDGSAMPLEDELASRGVPELAADDEFRRVFDERCWRCPDCGSWSAQDGFDAPYCHECDADEWAGLFDEAAA